MIGDIRFRSGKGLLENNLARAVALMESGATVEPIVEDVIFEGAAEMEDIVHAGGINQTKKGGARIKSAAMVNSIDFKMTSSGQSPSGEFGFINNPPDWTKYQEDGTKTIAQMLAFATAQRNAFTKLENRLADGDWFPTSAL